MGVMEGRDRKHITEKYKDLFAPLLVTNWQVWPIAQVSFSQFLVNAINH